MSRNQAIDTRRTDCFAFCERSCSILIDKVCNERECPFYKTQEEFERAKTPSRLTCAKKKLLRNRGLVADEWLLVSENKLAMVICNKNTKEQRTIVKRG